MNSKQKILLLLMMLTAADAYALANPTDSLRCSEQTMVMTAAEDGCAGEYCTRTAFVCVPSAWWTAAGVQVPSDAQAPLVLAFHGRGKQDLDHMVFHQQITPALKTLINNAPEAGIFGRDTNLHGAMPSAIVVYFQGLPTQDNWSPAVGVDFSQNTFPRGWQVNLGTDLNTNRDIKFVYKFVNAMINGNNPLQNHIDLQRIYAVGFSNGSRFVGVLWHDTSTNNPLQRTRLKAIAFSAAQAGDFPSGSSTPPGKNLFENSDPISIFMGMNTEDERVNFALQQQSISLAAHLLQVTINDTQSQTVTNLSSNLTLQTYIHNIIYNGSGHVWPIGQENMIAEFFGFPTQQ